MSTQVNAKNSFGNTPDDISSQMVNIRIPVMYLMFSRVVPHPVCPSNTFPKVRSMVDIRTDHHPFAAPDTPSFHDLLERVTAEEQLDPRRKADLRSPIRRPGHDYWSWPSIHSALSQAITF